MYFPLSKLPDYLIYLGGSDFPLWLSLPERMLLVHNGKVIQLYLYFTDRKHRDILITVGIYPGREASEPQFKGGSIRPNQLK